MIESRIFELKVFFASTSKTVSVDSSLKSFSTACIAASDPASCPAHTWSDSAEETTSFLSTDTVTFPVILRRISPTPIGRKRGFLSRGTSRHATNASMETAGTFSVQIFLIKLAIAFLRSTFVSSKLFERRIFLHPHSSIAGGPDPSFVLMAAFLIISSSIFANLIGWVSYGTPLSKTSLLAFFDFECFSFNLFTVSLKRYPILHVTGELFYCCIDITFLHVVFKFLGKFCNGLYTFTFT